MVSALCRVGQSELKFSLQTIRLIWRICQRVCRYSSVSSSRTLTWDWTCGFSAEDLQSYHRARLIPQTPCFDDSVNRKAMGTVTLICWPYVLDSTHQNLSSLPPQNCHLLCYDPYVGCRFYRAYREHTFGRKNQVQMRYIEIQYKESTYLNKSLHCRLCNIRI